MACGTPVIISDVSSLPEVAGDAGMCLPPHDIASWTAALRRAYHDAEWRTEASRKGLIEAGRYQWVQTAKATIASYQKALGLA
jgi:glycosyltransferase involved in cell wall biosynthesis